MYFSALSGNLEKSVKIVNFSETGDKSLENPVEKTILHDEPKIHDCSVNLSFCTELSVIISSVVIKSTTLLEISHFSESKSCSV